MWNIDFSFTKSDDCWHGAMNAFLRYYGYDVHLLEINRFVVSYFCNCSDALEDCISSCYLNQDGFLLKQYFNINVELYLPSGNMHKFLQTELEKAPVGVWLDSYDCKWLPSYKKLHLKHFCFLVFWDRTANNYICRDINFKTVADIVIPSSQLLNMLIECDCFRLGKFHEFQPDFMLSILNNSLQKISHDQLTNEKASFVHYIKNEFSLQRQKDQIKSIESSILLLRLLWLTKDKQIFSDGLHNLQNLFCQLDFSATCEMLEQQAEIFMIIRNSFIKGFLTDKINILYISDLIEKIYEMDLVIIGQIEKQIAEFKGL